VTEVVRLRPADVVVAAPNARRRAWVAACVACVATALGAASTVGMAAKAVSPRAPAAAPQGNTALDRFLAGLATLRVEFSQSLTDGRGRQVESLSGSLVVVRPGRFRWEVRPVARAGAAPGEVTQLMVADGRNVWFYDRELEQVTVKPAGNALTATPALLLSGTVELRSAFELRDAGTRAGLAWVEVKPRRGDAEFREARLGFDAGELRRMEIDDKLGQKAVLVFGRAQRNATVAPAETSFTPPAGVDVIGKPVG
jgi:outer membrane lipoprotein carrier protein